MNEKENVQQPIPSQKPETEFWKDAKYEEEKQSSER